MNLVEVIRAIETLREERIILGEVLQSLIRQGTSSHVETISTGVSSAVERLRGNLRDIDRELARWEEATVSVPRKEEEDE